MINLSTLYSIIEHCSCSYEGKFVVSLRQTKIWVSEVSTAAYAHDLEYYSSWYFEVP